MARVSLEESATVREVAVSEQAVMEWMAAQSRGQEMVRTWWCHPDHQCLYVEAQGEEFAGKSTAGKRHYRTAFLSTEIALWEA